MVQGFDGIADEGREEGSHGFGHGSELAYAVDFCPFRELVKMLADFVRKTAHEMHGEVGFSVALMLGSGVPTHFGTQCQSV